MQLLLISNSGRPFLQQYTQEIASFLRSAHNIAFLTAARLREEDAYYRLGQKTLENIFPIGHDVEVTHLKWNNHPLETLKKAEALVVGGGNTYVLLKCLREAGLIEPIRSRVRQGMLYVGASAGANVAGPNILTTNDWNVIGLEAFEALDLVPFNINPHYLEIDPVMAPYSETRDERIHEYQLVHENPVVGIEEGTVVRVDSTEAMILGTGRIKIFQRGQIPRWYKANETFDIQLTT